MEIDGRVGVSRGDACFASLARRIGSRLNSSEEYHGIGYYEGVLKFMGGRKQTEDFFRLFLVPGVHHSGGGPGFTEFDSMSTLENWVEKGQAPDKFIACRPAEGAERCRPIFPYPIIAHYSGKGDPKQAANFVPFDPTEH